MNARLSFFATFAGFAALGFACTSFGTDQVAAPDDGGRDAPNDATAATEAQEGADAQDAADAADAMPNDAGAEASPACTYVTSDYSGSSSSSSGASECIETDTFSCGTMTCACYTDGGGSCRCDGGAPFNHACATRACSPSATELATCGFPTFDAGGGAGSSSSGI